MSFAVVKFLKTDEVAVVPINWINDSNCFWPPKNFRAKVIPFIEKGITASDAWELYPVSTLGIFDNYKDARAKLSVAEDKSDLNTTDPENCGRGMRKKMRRRISSSSSTSSEGFQNSSILEDPPVFSPQIKMQAGTSKGRPCIPNFSKWIGSQDVDSFTLTTQKDNEENLLICSESLLDVPSKEREKCASLPNNLSESLLDVPSKGKEKCASSSNNLSGFQKTVLREINIIKINQKYIMETMDCIAKAIANQRGGDASTSADEYSLIGCILQLLPISNATDMSSIEEKLHQEAACNQMINYLKRLGGSTCSESVKRILKKLMTDDLAASFSFLGIRGKKSFRSLKLCKVILCAVRTHAMWKDIPESDVEKLISNWLRHAKARIQKKIVHL